MAYSMYDVRRIERMLKNGVESNLPPNDDTMTLFEEPPRFARNGAFY